MFRISFHCSRLFRWTRKKIPSIFTAHYSAVVINSNKKKLKNKYFVSRANEMAIYVAFVVRLAVYDLNEFE